MSRKTTISILACLLSLLPILTQAQSLTQYEYWFDDNYSNHKSGSLSGTDNLVNTSVDTDGLDNGVHKFSFRAKQSDGYYSAITSSLFLKRKAATSSLLEYWFDDNFDQRGSIGIGNTEAEQSLELDLRDNTKFPMGFHKLNIRVTMEGEGESAVYSSPVLKLSAGKATSLEYWIDGDIAHSRTFEGQLAPDGKDYLFVSDLDLGDITPGYHRLYCRAVSSSKCTTSAVTMMPILVKPRPNTNAKITRYSISIDNTPPATFQVENPADEVVVNRTIDASTLDDGEHELYMTFWNDADNSVSDKSSFVVDLGTNKLATPNPSTFKATNIHETGFTASWGKVNGALYYDILVKKVGGDYKYPAFNGGSTGTSIDVTGLEPNTSYLFQVRARNENRRNNSDWSPSIPNAVTTTNVGTTPAALVIHSNKGFDGSEPLTLGLSYHYNVWIANQEDHPWQGSFYLKDGNEDIKAWYNITIPKNSVRPLEFDYTPESVGSKSFVLYYQTKGRGSGIPVETRGGTPNIMTVQVNPDPTYNDGLQLATAIDCPETVMQGYVCDIKASIINNGGNKWSGTLYITDGGLSLEEKEVTLSSGQSIPLTAKNWSPETIGTHQIGVFYKSEKGFNRIPVPANGFTNPIPVEVLGAHALTDASLAKITHVTKGLVPEEVTVGSSVFYSFRITDEQGNRLQGLRLLFKCTGSSLRNSIESEPSDANGIAMLLVPTSDNVAIADRGQTVKMECTALLKNDNTTVQFYAEPSDIELKLKIHQGNSASIESGFENVEKMKFTLDLGVSAKANLGNYIKAEGSISFPLSLSMKFDDEGNFKEYTYDAKFKLSGKGSAGLYGVEKDANNFGYQSLIPEGSLGISLGYHRSYSSNDWKDIFKRLVMSWCDSYIRQTDWENDSYIKSLVEWYSTKRDDKGTSNYFFGGEASGGLKLLNSLPTHSLMSWNTKLPVMDVPELGVKGKFSFNFDFDKKKEEYSKNRTLTGHSSKYDLKGSFNFKATIRNLFKDAKVWWKTSVLNGFCEKHLDGHSTTLPENTLSTSLTVKQEAMFDENNNLKEVSHEKSLKTSWEKSFKDFNFPWSSIGFDAKVGITSTSSSKFVSKEDWATFIWNLAQSSEKDKELVRSVYPNLYTKYLWGAPLDIYNFWHYPPTGDIEKLVSKNASAASCKLKEAMKIEHTFSSDLDMSVNIPVTPPTWTVWKLIIDAGVNIEIENKPFESYYSIEDGRFLPISMHPSTSIYNIIEWMTHKLAEKFGLTFEDDRDEIETTYRRMCDVQGTGAVAGINDVIIVPALGRYYNNGNSGNTGNTYDPEGGNGGGGSSWLPRHGQAYSAQGSSHYGLDDFTNPYAQYIISRHPRLGENIQRNICTFTISINDGEQNFDEGVQIRVPHYYPAGDLLGITEQGDTLFVVSEVINVTAFKGETELTKSQRGEFEITGNVGVDDLTPFGFPEDQSLDVYYSAPGSKRWQYVGPAGIPLKVENLGAYMMATPITNDTEAPQITALLDEETGLMHINISDNIGVMVNTLRVFVNGEIREITMINESNFELQLSEEEMQYMVVVDITVSDLAENEGRLFVVFNIDKPDNTEIHEVRDGRNAEINLTRRVLTVDGASPEAIVTVYSLDGLVQAREKTDSEGHIQINLNSLLEGVYIVTLSDGKSKKFHVK